MTQIRKAIFVAALLFQPISSAKAGFFNEGFQSFVGVGGGYQTLQLDLETETKKSGYLLGGFIDFEKRFDRVGIFGLGLGLHFINQTGENEVREQLIRIMNPNLDLFWSYPLFDSGFEAGVLQRNMMGAGSHFDVFNTASFQYLATVGPLFRYRMALNENYDLMFTGSVQYDLNNPGRATIQIPLYVSINLPFGSKEIAASTPEPVVQATPEPVTEKPVLGAKPEVEIRLDAKLVTFDSGKSTLKPQSLKYLQGIAGVLANNMDIWKGVTIVGHTDGMGRKDANLLLSKARAAAVMGVFKNAGIPEMRMISEGYGDQQLLAGFPKNAEAHRRVELGFQGVTDAAKLKAEIDAVPKN